MTFMLEERPAESSLVETIWRARCECPGAFISGAATHWEMVVTKYRGTTTFTVRGPETTATSLHYHWVGAEWLGIRFKVGTFMPHLPHLLLCRLADRRDVTLPVATMSSFWLDGATWEIPDFDNADTFVDRLVRTCLLTRDPVVDAVFQGLPHMASARTVQYHFMQATGLRYKTIQQIERARRAQALLAQGASIPDTVLTAGYFDQAHLTNSLRRFLGQTPRQITREMSSH
jgi:AraC-like DNA-binding protein